MGAAGWALETPKGSGRCGPFCGVVCVQTRLAVTESVENVGIAVGVM
jgi:hypothetical protein